MTIRRRFLNPFLPAVLVLLSISAGGVLADSAGDRLFVSNDVLEITFEGPFRALSRDRAEEPEARPGLVRYLDAEGQAQALEVNFEPRGKSRRDRTVCTFPPLWVHFDKKATKGTLFEKQKKVKAVTYCRSPQGFQDYIVKEYLVYRIFNELADASFRVRLLKISFLETGSDKPLVRYGFFIEHKKRLAKRMDSKVAEPAGRIPHNSLEPEQAAIAELFQFMVSNTDFSFIAPPEGDSCCHNAVLFADETAEVAVTYMAVPYDFDRTGLVSPPNGQPAEELGQRTFRDRVFRGFCRDPQYLEAAIEKTLSSREAIEQLIREQGELSQRGRDQALKYLTGYYQVIEDPKRRARMLKCRELR